MNKAASPIKALVKLTDDGEPIYRQIAAAFAGRITSGELRVGDRLPGQRDIAAALGINLTTVTRAFSALQKSGLVECRPGRGTLVTRGEPAPVQSGPIEFQSAPTGDTEVIDLTVNRPATSDYLASLGATLARLPSDPRFATVQDYQLPEGPLWARRAVASWLAPVVGAEDAGRVVLTNGAQHGLGCVLAAIAQPGDLILADNVTYQGVNALCRALHLDISGVPMDRGGMQPDAFDRACRERRPRAVFLVPTFHNPTTITLSAERRAELIEIARRHNVLIIEDGVYAMLSEDTTPSFAATAPDLTIHVSGLSKCVAPGLRLGFVMAPRALVSNITMALRMNCWSINPMVALLGTSLIEDGSLRELVQKQKNELRVRQGIVGKYLKGFDVRTSATCTHLWLALPDLWRTTTFVPVARRLGVAMLAADAFTIGRAPAPNAVRINISAARSATISKERSKSWSTR